jgi:predicted exporter
LLQSAANRGLLEGWSSITTLLPSRAVQSGRLEAIPSQEALSANLKTAISETAFLESAFDPFTEVVEGAREYFPILPESFDGTPLDSWRDAHLLNFSDHWVALYTLNKPDAAALEPMVASWGDAVRWVDLQSASKNLMRDFRHDAAWAVAVAALIIALLLLLQRIGMRRLAWVALTVCASLAISICAVVVAHGYLTLVHLVALLLVLGLGLDYALFFSRDESVEFRRATIQSILACAASTTLAFGILSTSSIPLLRFLGLTVAVGSLASLMFAWLGSWQRVKA